MSAFRASRQNNNQNANFGNSITSRRALPGSSKEIPMRKLRSVLVFVLAFVLTVQPALSWSEGAHHVIGLIAFDSMKPEAQKRLLEILAAHPKFSTDFKTKLKDKKQVGHFMLGTAAYWPDVARDYPEYNRPSWHYQLGATLQIGNPPKVPSTPGRVPAGATLATNDLHITQAIELCRETLRGSAPDSEKAIAVCWLAHLVGDAHQPCHAGSLYVEGIFPGPTGDRGANSIPTKQRRNLHAVWDGLLGTSSKANDVSRRAAEVRQDKDGWKLAEASGANLEPSQWLSESVEVSKRFVYTPDVLSAVEAAQRSGATKVETVELSEQYLKDAGAMAQRRVAVAGFRLGNLLSEDLK
jgi:hypothetical protein